jgi:hypothetical protein
MTGAGNPQYGKFGAQAPRYKDRIVTSDGYVLVHAPGHPFAQPGKGLIMEHRLVMEAHLRATEPRSPHLIEVDGVLYLRHEIEVHHENEVTGDNAIENLVCLTTAEHARLHSARRQGG